MTEKEQQPVTPEIPTEAADKPENDNPPKNENRRGENQAERERTIAQNRQRLREIVDVLKSKIGAMLVKDSIKSTLKTMDASEYGGAPLIGLNCLVVKTHGSAKAKEVKNSILQCVTFSKSNINEQIVESLSHMPELTEE